MRIRRLRTSRSVRVGTTLTVNGLSTLRGGVSINGSLTVNGPIIIDGSLDLTGGVAVATVSGNVQVGSGSNAADLTVVGGDVIVEAGDLQVTVGNVLLGGDLDVVGQTTLADVAVTGEADVNILNATTAAIATLTTANATTLATASGDVAVGSGGHAAALAVFGDLDVGGATTVNALESKHATVLATSSGDVAVGSGGHAASLHVFGDLAVDGTTTFDDLTVDQLTSREATALATVSGGVNVGSGGNAAALHAFGAVTCDSGLTVTAGTTALQATTVATTLTTNGTTQLAQTSGDVNVGSFANPAVLAAFGNADVCLTSGSSMIIGDPVNNQTAPLQLYGTGTVTTLPAAYPTPAWNVGGLLRSQGTAEAVSVVGGGNPVPYILKPDDELVIWANGSANAEVQLSDTIASGQTFTFISQGVSMNGQLLGAASPKQWVFTLAPASTSTFTYFDTFGNYYTAQTTVLQFGGVLGPYGPASVRIAKVGSVWYILDALVLMVPPQTLTIYSQPQASDVTAADQTTTLTCSGGFTVGGSLGYVASASVYDSLGGRHYVSDIVSTISAVNPIAVTVTYNVTTNGVPGSQFYFSVLLQAVQQISAT